MSIPSQVEQCLSERGVEFLVVSSETVPPIHRLLNVNEVPTDALVVTVLLEDSLGRVQALLPSDCLLNLSQLCEQMGRNLTALPPQTCLSLAQKHGSDKIMAIPYLYDLPIVADARLLESQKIYLEVSGTDSYLEITREQFKKTLADADVGSFCVPLSRLKAEQIASDRAEVEKAIQNFTTLRIKQRLEQTLEMPPLPDTAEKIIQLRLDPEAGVSELAKVVERDPSLAAQVVSWASSPYYAAPGTIKSVHDAVVRVLGFDLVINLALGLALGKSVEMPKDGPHGVTPYWQEAVYTATMMEGLVKAVSADHRPSIGLSYLSGLLHNYGYLVLAHVFPPHFLLVNRHVEANPHVSHIYIERQLIGVTREQIGSLLMDCWNMPEEITSALRWQQTPQYEGEHAVYSYLLFVATNLLRSRGLYQGPAEPIPAAIYSKLHLDPVDAEAVLEKITENKDELKEIAKYLG